MADAKLDLVKLAQVNASVTVTHQPGAEKLNGFPLLTYAPIQYGAGVRTEDNGTPVAGICIALAQTPDLAAVAKQFSTTVAHVRQAHDYAISRLVPPPEASETDAQTITKADVGEVPAAVLKAK